MNYSAIAHLKRAIPVEAAQLHQVPFVQVYKFLGPEKQVTQQMKHTFMPLCTNALRTRGGGA